jgi:tetratricopeptide (TPR) repeat protein
MASELDMSAESPRSENIIRNIRYTLLLTKRGRKSELDKDVEAVLDSISAGLGYDPANQDALEAILDLRQYMWERGAWSIWDDYVVDAINVAEKLSRPTDAAILTIHRAGLREALGDWEQTLSLVNKSLSLAPDPDTKADALLYGGTALHNKGDMWKAYSCFREGLELTTRDSTRMRIKLKLSRTARALGRTRMARELVDELLRWKDASKWFSAEVVLEKVGYLKDNPEAALTYARRGLELYQELGFERGIAYAELALGQVFILLKRLEQASIHLERSAALFLKSQYWPGMAHVEFARGRISMKRKFYSRAAYLFHESMQYAARTHYRTAVLRGGMFSAWAMVRARQLREGVKMFVAVIGSLSDLRFRYALQLIYRAILAKW